jgi:hypothetical protein
MLSKNLHQCGGGEGGIRTLDTGLPYTRVPGVRLQPLGHLPAERGAHHTGLAKVTQRYATRHLVFFPGKVSQFACGCVPSPLQ